MVYFYLILSEIFHKVANWGRTQTTFTVESGLGKIVLEGYPFNSGIEFGHWSTLPVNFFPNYQPDFEMSWQK